jgi:uncharacterized protein (DUF697 family)
MVRFLKSASLSGDLLSILQGRVGTASVGADVKKPFRFFLCGDPALVSELRGLLLRGHDGDSIPLDAAATLETIDPPRRPVILSPEARCVIFLGRPGDLRGANSEALTSLGLPVFGLTVDPASEAPTGPALPPQPRAIAEYVVPGIDLAALRLKFFPQLVERCKGIEVAVGRRLPALRETVSIKLTRGAASSALKVAAASAIVDSVPIFGTIVGAVTSAGDMVAITGMQVALMLQIGAVYGKDPDVQRVWEMLPVVGGGFGWRALARELSGFIPVAGIPIKGAIAYAGTIVVGEATTFFYEHGRHMRQEDAAVLYAETKEAALRVAREVVAKIRRR